MKIITIPCVWSVITKLWKYVYKSQKPETWPWGAGLSLEHAQLETEATHNAPVKKTKESKQPTQSLPTWITHHISRPVTCPTSWKRNSNWRINGLTRGRRSSIRHREKSTRIHSRTAGNSSHCEDALMCSVVFLHTEWTWMKLVVGFRLALWFLSWEF